MKRTVAVFFGGRTPEHDVSIVSALQAIGALDRESYDVVPVYLAIDGTWWTGDGLLERSFYLPSARDLATQTQVTLDMTASRQPRLIATSTISTLLARKPRVIPFDVALPVMHGQTGEDGQLQGALETCAAAYTGMRTMASAVLMDKAATKRMLASAGIPQLPFREIFRPDEGLLMSPDELVDIVGDLAGPWCIKPSHLGSSIGVARVENLEELSDVLPEIFKFDTAAILEPFVQNMVEYNIAVSRASGSLTTSAIERPKRSEELLDFKEKYLAGGGGKKSGTKSGPAQPSEGMLSLTRELNPTLPQGAESQIREWAEKAFTQVGGTGAPRIDFISNEETGEIWLNEINPCPGSLGYFLWEAAPDPSLFADLLDDLITEALYERARQRLPADPTLPEARLFPRKS